MTLEEACKRFSLDLEKLKGYEQEGFLKPCSGDYTEDEIRRVGLIHSLQKAGMEPESLKSYLDLEEDTLRGRREKIRLLRKTRSCLLESIHEKQRSLDEIDYLIDGIRKNQGGNQK